MKELKWVIVIICVIIFYSCSNSTDSNLPSIKTGESIIFSKSDSSYFSFDAGRPISLEKDRNFIPDFTAIVATIENGDPLCIEFFSALTGENRNNIMIIGNKIMFDTLKILTDTYWDYGIGADTNKTYAIKTHDSKYALVLVEEAKYYLDSSFTKSKWYIGYIRFKWKYQTNGSRNFN